MKKALDAFYTWTVVDNIIWLVKVAANIVRQ